MLRATGPNRFLTPFQIAANKVIREVVEHAKRMRIEEFVIVTFVSLELQDLVRERLMEQGFLDVIFEAGSSFITVKGNPYWHLPLAEDPDTYIERINMLLDQALMRNRRVMVQMHVPLEMQHDVRRALQAEDWWSVEFVTFAEGGFVALTV